MQSCNAFVGNPKGLRDWAAAAALPSLPTGGEQAFLHGAPGRVFDARARTDRRLSMTWSSCCAPPVSRSR
jgi:hypothetical protein